MMKSFQLAPLTGNGIGMERSIRAPCFAVMLLQKCFVKLDEFGGAV